MSSILTESAAAVLLVIDESTSATLTEIARATGRPLSSIQRAVDGLISANLLVRETRRGPLRFKVGVPRQALRELARWRLGATSPRETSETETAAAGPWLGAPATIHDEQIRAAWPQAIGSIVTAYQPARVILFGSQARGDAGPDSDVDLLVVFDDDRDRRGRRIGIRRLLRDMPFAKDILVTSTAHLRHATSGSSIGGAMRDGVVVYER